MKYPKLFFIILLALILAILTIASEAQSNKTIIKRKGVEAQRVDAVWFYPTRNQYEAVRGKSTIVYSASEVEYVKPPQPRGFDNTSDIPTLENIIKNYQKRWWDIEAFVRLLPIYLKNDQAEKAVKLFEQKDKFTKTEIPVSIYTIYWEALMKSQKDAQLEKELKRTISSGSREVAAWAYVTRGDFLMNKGKIRQALVDGYLKVVFFFRDFSSARKAALEGAITAYDKLEDPKASELRTILKEEYPNVS